MMTHDRSHPMRTWEILLMNRRPQKLLQLPRAMEEVEPTMDHKEPRKDRLYMSTRYHQALAAVVEAWAAWAAALADLVWVDHPLELLTCHRECMRTRQNHGDPDLE